MKKKLKTLDDLFKSHEEEKEVYIPDQKKRYWRAQKGLYSRNPNMFDFIHLVKQWEDVVGKMLAQNTIPLKISFGTFYILSKHAVFSQELNFMVPMIIAKIEMKFPFFKGKIKKIRFSVGKFSSEEFNAMNDSHVENTENTLEKPKIHKFNPKYIAKKAEAEEFFSDVDDPEIKELLVAIRMKN